jgi:hypothetical protein
LTWGCDNKVPLDNMTLDQWMKENGYTEAAPAPAPKPVPVLLTIEPENPFDDDSIWEEALQQMRYEQGERENACWRYF